jgi:formylglycine-generating enzyme required for sulfatase activity
MLRIAAAWIAMGVFAPGIPPGQETTEKVTLQPPGENPYGKGVTRPTLAFPIPDTLVRFELVHLPGGRFKGSAPAPETGLKPFWIGKHEVSWGEFVFYYACPMEDVDGRSTASLSWLQHNIPGYLFDLDQPAITLRWHSAMAYCRWLSRKTGHLYRLPTEVEWEYACRAGSDKPAPESPEESAWFVKNSGDRTHKSGGKKPNGFGLHDMLGNVQEYCLESHQPPDFIPVLRGGAWNSPADNLNADRRQPMSEEWLERDPYRPRTGWWLWSGSSQGFRLVRMADASDAREREAYVSRIIITVLRHEPKAIRIGSTTEQHVRIWGETKNAGDRTLDELHIVAFFLDRNGIPHMMDVQERHNPTFNYAFPVLTHSAHPGEHREPLKPGQARGFVVDVPQSYDDETEVCPDKFGARVAGLVFAQE